jgi:putative SOS response-associated peptidase YedK
VRFALDNTAEVTASYNIRPTQQALTITRNSPNRGEHRKFGIPEPWNDKQLLINAKSETVSTLRTFSGLLRSSRCIIPASVFYEWKRLPDGKQPYAFSLKGGGVFAFAGLYTPEGPRGEGSPPCRAPASSASRGNSSASEGVSSLWRRSPV